MKTTLLCLAGVLRRRVYLKKLAEVMQRKENNTLQEFS